MTPYEELEITRALLKRSELIADLFLPADTRVQVSISFGPGYSFRSEWLTAHEAANWLRTFRLPKHIVNRPVVEVILSKSFLEQYVLLRTYQLRTSRPKAGIYTFDAKETTLSLVIISYNKWASRKVKPYLSPPWRSPSSRPPSEGTLASYTQATLVNGVLQNYKKIPYTSYSRNWTGVRTPGFGKIKKTHLPVNNHTVDMFRVGNYGEYLREQYFDSTGHLQETDEIYRSFGVPGGDSAPSFDGSLYTKAYKRLAAKAEVGIEGNLAQDLAQFQQTIDLISGSARRIAGSLTALRSGNFAGAAKSLWLNRKPRYRRGNSPSVDKSLADNWLELQYGWKPLLQDIHGSMEALARLNLSDAAVRRVASSAGYERIDDVPLKTNDIKPTDIGRIKTSSKYTCRLVVRYRVASPLTAFLSQTGFTNPLNLAWELLPFSFVADWFLPVGPWLETLSHWQGLEFKDGSRTDFAWKRVRGLEFFSGTLNMDNPVRRKTHYEGMYFSDRLKLQRSRLTSFPSASLPELKHGLTTEHALNGIALVRSVFSKRS